MTNKTDSQPENTNQTDNSMVTETMESKPETNLKKDQPVNSTTENKSGTPEKTKSEKIEQTAAAQKSANESTTKEAEHSADNSSSTNDVENKAGKPAGNAAGSIGGKESKDVPVKTEDAKPETKEPSPEMQTKIQAQKDKLEELAKDPNNQDPKIEQLNKEQDIESKGNDAQLDKQPKGNSKDETPGY